jgi:lipopolysaccharide transport system ATP-binding protein
MSKVYSPKSNASDLPDDVVLRVSGVSKKFCRNLRRSMWYGIQDLSKNLMGFRSNPETLDGGKTLVIRPETLDQGTGGGASAESLESKVYSPESSPSSLKSKVYSLKSNEPEDGLRRDEFWALKDINFDLKRGECLGLIGRNGCGKTTLLRLIAGIFPPDRGEIAIRGRVGALIALGAGFHPHMTGRENVYLNGAILGLSKREIDAQFDEIVDFAEIDGFIDAPVSTYSSGMRVRLGFAVAIQVKPDLLLIDEILAVGDVGFRSKCYAAISDLLSSAAVVFVSHQMSTVARICQRVLVLKNGVVTVDCDSIKGIEQYNDMFGNGDVETRELGTGEAEITNLHLRQGRAIDPGVVHFGESASIEFDLQVAREYETFMICISFTDQAGTLIAQTHSGYSGIILFNNSDNIHMDVQIPLVTLNPGKYSFGVVVFDASSVRHLCWIYAAKRFRVDGYFVGSAPVQIVADWKASSI